MINIPKIFKNDDSSSSSVTLPILPLRDIVVFPGMVVPLFVGRTKSVNALSEAMGKNKTIFLATQRIAGVDNPEEQDISSVGTVGTILQLLKLPDGTVKALVEGKARGRIASFIPGEEFLSVDVEPMPENPVSESEGEALSRAIIEAFEEYTKLNKSISKELIGKVATIEDSGKLADTVASHLPFKVADKQTLLEAVEISQRMDILLGLIKREGEIFEMGQKIRGRVKNQIEQTQKNYYLTEQMRAIKKEMGADDSADDELQELEKRIKAKRLSKEAAFKMKQEFKKLKLMSPMSAEASVVRNYIDWMLDLPWYNRSKTKNDLDAAEAILNQDHFGLEKPKERILEYLAVQSLVNKVRGPILCLVGPPGVGKTSLARSVARATGRRFIRISLGGVRDEAEIRGHRRTYVGAMPGKIIQNLKKAGVNNPVFCLDEVDKMSTDFRGDPSSALLEVLDPEQNNTFNDHFLDVDYDLSDILFITTANTLSDIPLPLQDRMEVIRIPGYTEHEKYMIAKEHLIPKQTKMNGLKVEDIDFSKQAIFDIIRNYTREAGVRNLEREISGVCRKSALEVVKKKAKKPVKIIPKKVEKLLGPIRFRYGQVEEKDQIGIVTGLAWTQVGGELLCIETALMPGKGQLTVTGQLGDVMKESARAAVSYVRSKSSALKLDDDFYSKVDIHIHVPEGAIPKDGPSAGITMCTALVSAFTKLPVDKDVAMTGEITLRGRVLPIGGLKEKILAAHRGGLKKVIIPKENEKDLEEIPATILKQMTVIPADHLDEVLKEALIIPEGSDLFTN
ncbi:Lon protease [Desulfoluna limicola]|uniref:Lon protease n=1 Tax=Desulfoluna limicola TaxID=2810562 RepID=A0ABM7PIV2_9BACT|nr:endopeptidase La [Desulfoluna limicola]BCS97498.1 Lon protease [Desulfoluna limicola]